MHGQNHKFAEINGPTFQNIYVELSQKNHCTKKNLIVPSEKPPPLLQHVPRLESLYYIWTYLEKERSLCYIWTYQDYRSLYYIWTYLDYRSLCYIWMYLDYRSLCYIWTYLG
jgi:hypothetical protein